MEQPDVAAATGTSHHEAREYMEFVQTLLIEAAG